MIDFIFPKTGEPLTLKNGHLESPSGKVVPVIKDIPRFVEQENYASAFGLQWKAFRLTQLDSNNQMNLSQERLERCLGYPISGLNGKNLLEVGCGAGRFTELLVKSGASVHSVDLSVAVEANKENIGDVPNFQIAQASVYELPFPENSFDVVVCLGVIQHTPSSEKTIEELWRMTKPGGLLVIDHYRWRIAYYLNLKPVYRHFLRKMSPDKSKVKVDKLVDFFFPIHWKLRKIKPLWWLLHRFSPLIEYILLFPQMKYAEHLELCRLDSYDSLTDYYKHLRTPSQIEKQIKDLGGKNIWINVGGNGVEARATK
ncbi:MAG: class I SAM-dependent methyltransferase [Bacteroidia bacterium]|nr:class I SAM-dependent methyltransferase [Bacteroidia bacterium]